MAMIPLLLTGPAGSGKTYRCLAEIAEHLRRSPEGLPLLLIAPRQATYQLERQILSLPGVDGFSRLRILSFQRLAQFIFEMNGRAEPKLLDEQGRVMVMRAILGRRKDRLRVYRQSAHHEALAQELSDLWREACEHNVGPQTMRAAAQRVQNQRLRAKLEDFADIFEDYQKWLAAHQLRDGDELLDLAAEVASQSALSLIGGLWLDGFAQMTPQERRLLNATLPKCAEATLAFCLPQRPLQPSDGFSMWSVLSRTYCQLREELTVIFQAPPREETLPRRATTGRFDAAPALAHLEQRWGAPCAFDGNATGVRIVKCADFETEAIFTAREILKFVRNGGRFREAAVLVRSLEPAHDILRRVFHRYGIKFFVDRREAVAHHPLAELTRGALRTVAFGYKHHDLFCALKSGLAGIVDGEIDWFENMALARGWNGDDWRGKLSCGPNAPEWQADRADKFRKLALRPIFRLEKHLGKSPSGSELAAALRDFWDALDTEERLVDWAEEAHEALHSSVWTQMQGWLVSIDLAFGSDRMPLAEWLTIVEAGLSSLTVGLIPPSLDQTLIGAVDRSRNPDLKAVFLLGANEGIFPKPGAERLLLNDSERDALAAAGVHLGVTSLWNLVAEQFYGYIACTRARESLSVTFSETAPDGEPLNHSIFVSHLQRLFPSLAVETFAEPDACEAESAHELNSVVFGAARRNTLSPFENELLTWPAMAESWTRARAVSITEAQHLSADKIAALYGPRLATSVSRLEQFASCALRFFINSGLRAEERLVFELDRREQGSFQHDILAEFHRRVAKEGKRWRDVDPSEARRLVGEIASEMETKFQDGLAVATDANRFLTRAKVAALQEFMETYVALMRACEFDPHHVELGFGRDFELPSWIVEFENGALEFSGRIDRVDVWEDDSAQRTFAIALDYKSSQRRLDRVMVENAIQQQLLAYLAVLEAVDGSKHFKYPVTAVGAFYADLNPRFKPAASRAEAMQAIDLPLRDDLKQFGIFDWDYVSKLDPTGARELFQYEQEGPNRFFKTLSHEDFRRLLEKTTAELRALGRRIFEGDVTMDPFRHKKKTPCSLCYYSGICRIDPWTHEFRKLRERE